jgi:phage shock protein PspC (stress-responsive transcriptional regulator)
MKKRLRLSDEDSVFGGVCGGLGEYFDLDPVLIRVPLFLAIWLWGVGLIVYFAFWIAMPPHEDKP